MTIKQILYTARATAKGNDDVWQVASDDGKLDLTLAIPAPLRGTGGGTNPEQIFAAGFAACMHHTVKFYGQWKKQNVDDSSVEARVSVGPRTDNATAYEFAVHLHFSFPHLTQFEAERLVAKAHSVCPYSRMASKSIDVTEDIHAGA